MDHFCRCFSCASAITDFEIVGASTHGFSNIFPRKAIFQTSNTDLWQFCSPLSKKDSQYIILKYIKILHCRTLRQLNCNFFKVSYTLSSHCVYVVGGLLFNLQLYILSASKLLIGAKNITKAPFYSKALAKCWYVFSKLQSVS